MSTSRALLRRLAAPLAVMAVLAGAAILQLADANPAASQTTVLHAWAAASDPGLDPASATWKGAAPVQVPLTAQAGTYLAGGGSIPLVTARALHFNNTLYVRLEWDDTTQDDSTARVEQFADAAAVEFPAKSASTVPSICMGQANAGVNIWQWRADSEAVFDIANAFPNALTDGSPLEFYTARDAGNPYSRTDGGPVQNLVAQAFGTLSTSPVQDVQGHGVYDNGRWSVVFARTFAGAGGDLVSFNTGTRTDMAFAVWNGSEGDRNGRKSISQFVTLAFTNVGAPGNGTDMWAVGLAAALFVGITALGIGLAVYGIRERGR